MANVLLTEFLVTCSVVSQMQGPMTSTCGPQCMAGEAVAQHSRQTQLLWEKMPDEGTQA